jgi:ABC-type Zn uptake system ZnuABC Zn-binding protein ZnuA
LRIAIPATALLAVALAGCGAPPAPQPSADTRTTVVATTPHVADLVRNVAGGRARVVGLIPAGGADPHEHEPRPSEAEAVAGADVVVRSGGEVDVWADALIEASPSGPIVIALIDRVRTLPGAGGAPDPHWWQDPGNAILAVEAIQEALVEADPAGEGEYRRNAARYIERLRTLDATIVECIHRLPPDARKLVTEHDALGYYADRYGFEVIGAAIPALTTQAQPSAGETSELVDQVRSERVRAIFPESGLNPELARAIADEADATVGGELWADTLGPEASGAATYVEAMRTNTQTIAEGLSAGEVSCP